MNKGDDASTSPRTIRKKTGRRHLLNVRSNERHSITAVIFQAHEFLALP